MAKKNLATVHGTDLQYIDRRIRKKYEDYDSYHFSASQNDVLKTFFDLAQEFDSFHDFYRICVLVPCDPLKVRTALYLVDKATTDLQLVTDSISGIRYEPVSAPSYVKTSYEPYDHKGSLIVPIARKQFRKADAPAMKKAARVLVEARLQICGRVLLQALFLRQIVEVQGLGSESSANEGCAELFLSPRNPYQGR